ncbi:MAG: hypothetical protein IPN92_11725 [Chromatiaceae bacterium]|nr:hypothetical protein [Chromatiaceae bacterium]
MARRILRSPPRASVRQRQAGQMRLHFGERSRLIDLQRSWRRFCSFACRWRREMRQREEIRRTLWQIQ